MRLPKITKYSVIVIAGGTIVWPQMRMMRPYSRRTIVRKPMRRMRARDSSLPVSPPPRGRAVLALDEPHEQLLEPVDLVAHADDLDALLRQAREHVVQALLLLHLDLDRVVVARGAST